MKLSLLNELVADCCFYTQFFKFCVQKTGISHLNMKRACGAGRREHVVCPSTLYLKNGIFSLKFQKIMHHSHNGAACLDQILKLCFKVTLHLCM